MDFTNFDKEHSSLEYKGIVADIYHRDFEQGTFEYVVMRDTVRVLAVTQQRKLLILKETVFSSKVPFFSLPGGSVEGGESPKTCALRELREETGFTTDSIEEWFSQNASQTIISRKHYFIATNCYRIGQIHLEHTENIQVLELDVNDFLNKVTSDRFKYTELQNKFLKMELDPCQKSEFAERLRIQL